jgi:hypothetical protein
MKLVTMTLVLSMILACSGGTDPVVNDITAKLDFTTTPDGATEGDLPEDPDIFLIEPDVAEDVFVLDLPLDKTPEIPFPTCDPGTGCFLDSCSENGHCLSGWCVEHMGDGVCTLLCQEECPDGWSCKTVGTGPDVVSICISAHSNLCKPCASNADCKSPGGAEDVCVDYSAEGNFCGGTCQEDKDCPWGFSCNEHETVDGTPLLQCVSDTGSCPCTPRSVALALATPCNVENDSGICAGKRVCTEDGLSECDAETPVPEECNGMDDNCDGDVDEPLEVGGDYVNLCSDDNDCTEDTCLGAEGCTYEVLTEGECIDGDACTVGDHCEDGVCVGNPVACDDNNPCTDDSCDGVGGCLFENNKDDCDDEDPCTVADDCSGSVCAGVAVACECQTHEDCDTLEDGDLCTGTLFCDTENLPHQCATIPDSPIACPDPAPGPDEVLVI